MINWKAKAEYHFSEARRLFKESFTHIPHIHMKRLLPIIGILALVVVPIALGFGMRSEDTLGELNRAKTIAEQAQERARVLACAYLGELTESCFKGSTGACEQKEKAIDAYSEGYGLDAMQDCAVAPIPPGAHGTDTPTENHETEVSTPEGGPPQALDPTFFGDEEPGA